MLHHKLSALALSALALSACSGRTTARAPAGKSAPATSAPTSAPAASSGLAPGADLTGPLAPPSTTARRSHDGPAPEPLDLGRDRPALRVELPRPPRGASASFQFGDQRRGWITRIPESNQLPSVAYGGGRVYVSGGFESVSFYALDANSGRIEWASQELEDNGPTAPVYLAEENRVVFNTESCTVFVMNAKTGKKIWFKYLGDPTLSQPAVSAGLVLAAHPSGSAHALSAYRLQNGNEVWARAIDGELLAAPVIHDGAAYASTVGGNTYKFNLKSGKKLWQRKLHATTAPWLVGDQLFISRRAGGREVQVVVDAGTGDVLSSHTSVAGGYLGDVPKNLNNWKQVWAFEGSRPAVIGGVRYVAMGGRIEASDAATGDPLWIRRYAPAEDDRSVGSVALAGAQLVIATRKGEIYGLDIDTGYTVWAYDLATRVIAQPVIANGWVFVTSADGQVIALEVADKSLDGWHMWGGDPHHNGPVTGGKI